jgi:hypothetical protein
VLQKLAKRTSRLYDISRQFIHLDVSIIADDHPLGCIEHEESLRHIVDGSVYPQVGLVKFHICGVEASGVLSISPDVGHQCSAERGLPRSSGPVGMLV